MKWYAMTEKEKEETLLNMYYNGTPFAKALADLWALSNPYNDEKLAHTFPEIVERYAPKGL